MFGVALVLPLLGLALGMMGSLEDVSDKPSEGDDLIDKSSQDMGLDLVAHAGDDTVVGTEGDDFISVGDGDDVAIGGGGEDVIEGGAGDDFLSGNTLGETYGEVFDDHAPDLLKGGEGNDTLIGYGDETLIGGAGADSLHLIHDMNNDDVPSIEDFDPDEDQIIIYLQGVDDGDEVEVSAETTPEGIALTIQAGEEEAIVHVAGDNLTTQGMDFSFLKLKVAEMPTAA
ncbi:hypothetical protein K3X41_07285 [Aliiroseovarius crassostreae]|uniref:calcium-binding protein n=1 Tax=Aliiroseovarius crassostreae TaxID=154981 RepID=UPI0021FDADA3|nr:hypothetical protein [Aliiroseovarius crassostreae]UWQ09371.1 hypothetical protein K3X25_07430 [Aliiroseovarius crassostreae]UWQ12447.1 hypothetical protein K3X41_07285 [Aliiroseovarius crassostreae]